MSRARPRFYFSFRSPYSWIAARLIAERPDRSHADIDYLPWWEPDAETAARLAARGARMHYTTMTKAKHLYILHDVARLTRALGWRHGWPIDIESWWELPHLAYLAARRLGEGEAFFWAVSRARWELGEDICRPETIRRIAADLQLDPDVLAGAPADHSLREEGIDALVRSDEDGVFGVPFFVASGRKFWGVDRLTSFLAQLDGGPMPSLRDGGELAAATIPQAVGDAVPYDTDTAGGCG